MTDEHAEKPPEILFDFGPPPPRRLGGPIIDGHAHVGDVAVARPLVETARQYGVGRMLGITRTANIEPLREAFGDFLDFAVSLNYDHRDDPAQMAADCLAILDEAHALGARMVKFWFKPEFNASSGLTLDDDRMRPIFSRIEALGLVCVAHIADPDAWFATRYADVAKYGTKRETYRQLERVLERHPAVTIQAAHMGGDPEDLDHLHALLTRHENLCLDTSATKWVVRELSRKPAEARAFFIEHADRLIFGSDLVARKDPHPRHYASRYWTLQQFLETDCTGPSPINDPDGGGTVTMTGLNLPDHVLERIYHHNAEGLLGVRAGQADAGPRNASSDAADRPPPTGG